MTVALDNPPRGASANAAHLELELHRLRLLARRRALWLRERFGGDPLAGYGRAVTSDERADLLLAGDDEASAAAFYRENADARALGTAIAAVEAELTERRSTAASALVATTRLFELSDFERDVLMLALAPELDAGFARACGYLTDDATRRLPTPRLALELLPGDDPDQPTDPLERAQRAAAFERGARLRRLRLVELSAAAAEPLADRALALDERVAGHLRGFRGIDARLAALARPAVTAALPERAVALAADLATAFAERAPGEPPPLVNLVARPGAGADAVAAEACRRIGLAALVLDARALAFAAADDREIAALVERESLLGSRAFVVDARDADPDTQAALEPLVEAIGVPVFVVSDRRWPGRRRLLSVDVPWPTPRERAALIASAVGHPELPGAGAIAEHFDIGPADVADVAGGARETAALRGTTPDASDLWRACRRRADHRIATLADRIEVTRCWDDIVLPPDAMEQLREIAAQAARRATVYGEWGFGAKLGQGRGIASLFAGASGTGKTLAAEILAGELDLDLYRIDLARVVSKYIGETEKNLRDVVRSAERAGAMVLFDEADSLFAGRTDVRDSRDRYANLQVNYLLQLMEAFRGVAVLATNRRGVIDPAFLRRLRFVVEFPLPDAAARRAIWQRSFPPDAPLGEVDWDALARLELTGGSISTVAVNAAFLGATEDVPIAMRHIMRAARREYGKLDRLSGPVDFTRWDPAEEPA